MAEFAKENVKIEVQGVALDLAVMQRAGNLAPIFFLHGFGSTKEDYADIARYPAFDGHPVIAYDAPGCGATRCADLSKLSVPFLVATAKAVLAHYGAVALPCLVSSWIHETTLDSEHLVRTVAIVL